MNRWCALGVLLPLLTVSVAHGEVSREERQYHWELISAHQASVAEVDRILSYCTGYADDIDEYMRESIHIFEVSFDSVVRSYETHNARWWGAISSTWGAHREGGDRASDFIDRAIWGDGLTDDELCDKLLWVKVAELEAISEAMMDELEKRKTPYVSPMGLSRLWKTETTNTWENSVVEPYRNLRRLFDANPYHGE